MMLAFIAGDVAILRPETWRYCAAYVVGNLQSHHGYLYAGRLYLTSVPISPLGVPATYYLRLFATKVPLVLLAAVVPGVIEMVRRRHERGFVFLRVLAVFLIVPYSLMAAKFLRYALPMLVVIDLIAAVGLVAGVGWLLRKAWLSTGTKVTVAALAVVVFVVGLVASQQWATPFYSLSQNGIGASLDGPGVVFPEETYDYGVREAVAAIAAEAGASAQIVSDTPAVVAHYLERNSRPDIGVSSLSGDGLPSRGADAWVIVQDEHETFENHLLVEQLRTREIPWLQVRAGDALALQVFHGRNR
jgi:hypothetical protein